ncbi:MAG: hypothetical protein FWF29_03350, partial [Treponema sp.]|nr:hypothetical protein [Treponema sp.]
MNKNISCIGIALVIAMLVFGLAGCPTGSNPTPNPPQTNSEADLLTLAVSNSSDTSVAIGDPIYDDDWYAFADSGGFTGLWAEATGTVAITSVDSSFDAKIALTVSDGASAFISGPVISANAVPADNTFVPYDPAATITVQDNRYLYVQVISENTKIMNFYRFKVSLTELGSSILINSITVGSVEADPGVPGSTDWPASANYGTVVLSPATNSGVVTASPAVTGAGGPTILYGRSASATPAPELSSSLSGAATPFTDGTFIFVKVTAQNELTSAYYIIQVEIGRNANLDPDEQVNSTTSPPTTTYGGVTATGNNAGSLGTPSATLPISSANIGGVSVSYIFGEIPAGGFAVMAKTQADDAAVAFATGPANAAASALVFANAAGTGVDKSGTVKPASADEILFVRVTAGNGTTVQYYALTLLYNKSGNIKFGIPTIDLASKYIDPIWNDPDLDVYNIDGRTYDTGENVLEYRNAVASGDKDTYTYGDARCLWDDTGVYVYIRVAKAYPAVGSIPAGTSNFFGTTASYQHMWDSVEVFINESVTANGDVKTDVANITTTGGGQYRLSPGPGTTMNRSGDPTPATTGTGFGNTAAYPASGWAVAAGDPGSLDNRPGYVVIMKVPFRFLSAYPVANGKKIGLDLQINVANANGSANTGRIGVMVWKNRTASNYENCTLWGVATLTGKLVDLPAISGQPEASHTYVIADSPTAVPLSVTATLPSSGGV